MTKLRILIEGIGGIGGVIAAKMIRAGLEPTLITSNSSITEAINSTGIQAITPKERFTVSAKALTRLEDVQEAGCFDVALLVMKAGQVMQAAQKSLPLLKPETGYVVTLQNGIVEDKIAEIVGQNRLISGIVGWGGTFHGPGISEKTGPGKFHIGELDGQVTERVRRLAEALKAVSPVVISKNIRGALWAKLGINCTITTMGALTGDTLGQMLKQREVRDAFLMIYREVVDTAEAFGIKLERIAGNPKLLYLHTNAGFLNRSFKDLLVQIIGSRYGRLKSSSLQSLERGRKTEIDFLNGHVVEKAKEVSIDVPLNSAIVRLIKKIENKERKIERQNLSDLLEVMNQNLH
ncbi:MAG: ketopantoate reductase family protein [Proteobacteria bacterium]|nr:ketopantoate reductase family protein [Pseudomonadota bacterium]